MNKEIFCKPNQGDIGVSESTIKLVEDIWSGIAAKHQNSKFITGISVWENRDAYLSEKGKHYPMVEIDHQTMEIIVHVGNIRHEAQTKNVPVNEVINEMMELALNKVKPFLQ